MNAWKGKSVTPSIFAKIKADALLAIEIEIGSRLGSVETGGILVGYYRRDNELAVVTEAVPPPRDSQHGVKEFVCGVCEMRELLESRWNEEPRQYYLGEWHYHPAKEVVPSAQDLETMKSISSDHDYKCNCPLLVILGERAADGKRQLRVWACPRNEEPVEIKKEGAK